MTGGFLPGKSVTYYQKISTNDTEHVEPKKKKKNTNFEVLKNREYSRKLRYIAPERWEFCAKGYNNKKKKQTTNNLVT